MCFPKNIQTQYWKNYVFIKFSLQEYRSRVYMVAKFRSYVTICFKMAATKLHVWSIQLKFSKFTPKWILYTIHCFRILLSDSIKNSTSFSQFGLQTAENLVLKAVKTLVKIAKRLCLDSFQHLNISCLMPNFI